MVSRFYATQALLEHGIKTLPVTQEQIQEILTSSGWEILHFDKNCSSHMEILKKYNLLGLARDRKAFTYAKKGIKLVCVEAGLSNNELRLLLAHELGHIVMCHLSPSGVLGYHASGLVDNPQEDEANAFALAFLAPACVLHKQHITEAHDVSAITLLDGKRSQSVADELNHYTISSPLEVELCERFEPFFAPRKNSKHNKLKYVLTSVLVTALLLSGYFYSHSKQENIPATSTHSEIVTQESLSASVDMPLMPNNALDPAPEATASKPDVADSAASEPDAPEPAAPEREEAVIVTPSGKRYHRPNCQHVKNRTSVISITIQQALESGYTPCQTCLPDED